MVKKQNKSSKIDYKWYVAVLILRFELNKKVEINNSRKMCTAHENVHLIRAQNSEEAYQKSCELGKISEDYECVDEHGRKGYWKFVGINELLPVYEEIEDGCEVLWVAHYRRVSSIESMVKQKKDLGVFRKD